MITYGIGLMKSPKHGRCGGRHIVRYGYEEMSNGIARFVEKAYYTMPNEEDLRKEVEQYNAEHGINEVFNPQEYGY